MKTAIGMLLSLAIVTSARAQSVEGDWQGTLKTGPAELRLVVHVTRGDQGGLTGTLDSPDQNVKGIAIPSVTLADGVVKFAVPQIGGAYEARLDAGANAMAGTWRQGGSSFPLDLSRAAAVQARNRVAKPSDIDGDWEGTLEAGPSVLHLVMHITTYDDGMTATLDSPDQNGFGIPMTSIAREGAMLRFEMKQLAGSYSGTLDAGLASISGTWMQVGNSLPLAFERRKKP
jgi:hypothetical protein